MWASQALGDRYVKRDGAGKVTGSYALKQLGRAEEKLPDDHPDLVEYTTEKEAYKQNLGDDALIEELRLRIEALEARPGGR